MEAGGIISMKKFNMFIGLVIATLVLGAIAAFANPFADVPTDHWAYPAVDFLQNEGVMIGYPDGLFKGDQLLTRYEFAEAIARMVKDIAAGKVPSLSGKSSAIIKQLQDEFKAELDKINERLNKLEGTVGANSERITGLEQDTKKINDWITKTDKNIGSLLKTHWSGNLSYEFRLDTETKNFGNLNGGEDRYTQWLQFHLGATHELDADTSVTWRLATDLDQAPNSWFHLGGKPNGAGSSIGLDRAYVKWAPWGSKTDDGKDKESLFWLYAGLTDRVEESYSTMVYDPDVTQQGITAQWILDHNYTLTAWHRLVRENATDGLVPPEGTFDDDTTHTGIQLSAKHFISPEVRGYLGYSIWNNADRLTSGVVTAKNYGGAIPDWNNDKLWNYDDINFLNDSDYGVLNAGLAWDHRLDRNFTGTLYVDYLNNLNSGITGAEENGWDLHDFDTTAMTLGYMLYRGDQAKRGSWALGVAYSDIGLFSTPAAYSYADFGTGMRGWTGSFNYRISPSSKVIYTYINQTRNLYYSPTTNVNGLNAYDDITHEIHTLDFVWNF